MEKKGEGDKLEIYMCMYNVHLVVCLGVRFRKFILFRGFALSPFC